MRSCSPVTQRRDSAANRSAMIRSRSPPPQAASTPIPREQRVTHRSCISGGFARPDCIKQFCSLICRGANRQIVKTLMRVSSSLNAFGRKPFCVSEPSTVPDQQSPMRVMAVPPSRAHLPCALSQTVKTKSSAAHRCFELIPILAAQTSVGNSFLQKLKRDRWTDLRMAAGAHAGTARP